MSGNQIGNQNIVICTHCYTNQRLTEMKKRLHQQQLNKFLWRLGYKDVHTPHGFRASAITMIQERLKYAKHLPDMQSGHKTKDNNGEAYSRVTFLDERAQMMQDYADYLTHLTKMASEATTEESS